MSVNHVRGGERKRTEYDRLKGVGYHDVEFRLVNDGELRRGLRDGGLENWTCDFAELIYFVAKII